MSLDYFISAESLDLLHIIENKSNLSQRQIAKEIGFSLGKVNYCLKALIDIGFIKINNFNTSNQKLKYTYILTPKGARHKVIITKKFIAKKMHEYEKLKKYIKQ